MADRQSWGAHQFAVLPTLRLHCSDHFMEKPVLRMAVDRALLHHTFI